MTFAILFHFLCAEHVSDINISIITNLELFCLITKLAVLFCKDGGFSINLLAPKLFFFYFSTSCI